MKQVVFTALCVMLSAFVFGQYSITGVVKDSEINEPLINANIIIEENSKGVSTDFDGKFVIKDIAPGSYTLLVSYIGYKSIKETVVIRKSNVNLTLELNAIANDIQILPVVRANALRATELTPMTYYNMSKEELEANNLGQDVPYLLQMTPSTVVTSDAGHGVGYTGIRIRGTDPSRINVTINGIPVNDAESQGVFWVNLPDIVSSAGSIQIQRGVGTSTNGAGAFGGTINLETDRTKEEPFVGIDAGIGSFGTLRSNVSFDTGLKKGFNINGRASLIQSDGYIDRATSDLWSYYLSASYIDGNNSLEFINFHGKEITYQAWYGLDPSLLESDRTFNAAGTERTPNPYDNQVDNYQQTYYQLLHK